MVMRFAICFILFAVALPALAIDRLTASVDKNPVLVGEYFTLTIEANGKVSGQMPDTSAIAKNFVTGPISTSSRTQIVNGSMSSATSWQMQVMSRSAGEFTLPAFEVSGIKSQPINLRVVARESDDSQQKDIFVTTELAPQSLYVQQAALYTVKLFIGKDLLDAQMSQPTMNEGSITAMGQQEEAYEVVDGRRYRVITRKYLIQPQKSGNFTVEGPIFNGQVREGYRRMAVSAVGESIDVEVKPIPNDYKGAWLPSELVNLAEEWQPEDKQVVVGSPITRTFTLTALGITKEQMPDIDIPSVDGFRIYPDETDRNQMARDGRVISQMVASYALLPQKPGTYTLPEIKLPWFNTVINRIQYATLPARTVEVIADPNQPQTPTVQPQPNVTMQSVAPSNQVEPTIIYRDAKKSWVDWVLTGLGYVLWLITLVVMLLRKSHTPVQASAKDSQNTDNTNAQDKLKQLAKVAKQNEARQFYTLLREYVELAYQQPLKSWTSQQPTEIREEIAKLQASLYSANKKQVDLVTLYNHMCKIKKRSKSDAKNRLETLY
ncbi:protein BatD [Pseudoalteromonas luteoviolacea]|uniref:Protein BatD n=1 Tax=Pseudoalteromonas luteoviolacea TaxID=43657 RepID=A0A0C1MJV9_9GAMM|nr:BatD family protein [Pseudoalteromonas luteoviolacea]KID57314.1 protein BatD [Pseudoalteromonas luteoviolacea]